jgi:protocatechuate 4,5-dioxygenase, alpha chain
VKRHGHGERTNFWSSSFIDKTVTVTNGGFISMTPNHSIPGTFFFDGALAQRGYALNRMCYSFNEAANRADFLRDQDAYCTKFNLTAEQRRAVKARDILAMLESGGNIYYVAKLAGIFNLNVQDIGAQQTGMTVEAFKALLAR